LRDDAGRLNESPEVAANTVVFTDTVEPAREA